MDSVTIQPEDEIMQWGTWRFEQSNLTLVHSKYGYEIDLEEIDTCAQMLDWIFQLQRKTWADANTMHDLLRALQDILNPQANYRSLGADRQSRGTRLANAFAKRLTA